MPRRRALGAIACLVVAVVALALVLRGDGDGPAPRAVSTAPVAPVPPQPVPEVPPTGRSGSPSPGPQVAPSPGPQHPPSAQPAAPPEVAPSAPATPPVAPAVAAPRGPLGALISRRTQLRRSPGGPVVRTVGLTTGYGSERVLAVVARRGRWLGVLTDHMPNSRAAWIPADSAELVHEPYRLDLDLSERRITVRREGRVVRRIRVAIGKPSTATPVGRFAVTDTLRISKSNPEYGCCAVALTGRQPNLPQGWSSSNRLAIHGTPNESEIGGAISNGCPHASEKDMRWLLRHLTLGAQVRIRA